MRFVTYEAAGEWRGGALVDGLVVDFGVALGHDRAVGVREALGHDRPELKRAVDSAQGRSAEGLRLGPPVPDPEKIVCLGLNYRDHATEVDLPIPAVPTLFAKYRNSLIGHLDEVVLPTGDHPIDYEGELAIVVGKRCKEVDVSEARGTIAGLTCFNDVTARDLQFQTSQWTAGKAIDTFAPCGPCVVGLDHLGAECDLSIQTRLNGTVMQDSSTAEMIFDIYEIVSRVSSLMTLAPGDLIATGTPAGVGFSQSPQVSLKPGDEVEVEIEGIGILKNPVVARSTAGGDCSTTAPA